jgi:hypothetical protein
MEITTELELINQGRVILESHLGEIEKTPGYIGWTIHQSVDFIPYQTSLIMLVNVEGSTPFKEVAAHIEHVEDKAYTEFADLEIPQEIEGKVNIFIFMDFEEET